MNLDEAALDEAETIAEDEAYWVIGWTVMAYARMNYWKRKAKHKTGKSSWAALLVWI